jgi:hypothetical protein
MVALLVVPQKAGALATALTVMALFTVWIPVLADAAQLFPSVTFNV